MITPEHIVIIDIDGLRRDVFQAALSEGGIPHIEKVLGGHAAHVDALSVAPSITFAAQAAIFTGEHPTRTGIPGNDFFDRVGKAHISGGHPRHYDFSVGDTKAYDDAVLVFVNDLADKTLSADVETIYESAAAHGLTSLVVNNMYARGATHVVRPSIVDIARFTKGRGIFGLQDGAYDDKMIASLASTLQDVGEAPNIITAYFMGLDHHSHKYGPSSQRAYLEEYIDPQVGELVATLEGYMPIEDALFVIVSDHGQIATPGDDPHSIRLGFPFDMELSPLFHALGLDLHDIPGEDPAVDAVVGLNGGFAHVYLRHREDDWPVIPRFEDDILRVADAFHEMNDTGKYRDELQNTLEFILVKNAEADGWGGDYHVHLSDGTLQDFPSWLAEHTDIPLADAHNRVRLAANHMSGDLILGTKAGEGVYFGAEGLKGVHGSLHHGDSQAVLSFGVPSLTANDGHGFANDVYRVISQRCATEGGREPSIADMALVLRTLWAAD
jgi:hypothetical protein